MVLVTAVRKATLLHKGAPVHENDEHLAHFGCVSRSYCCTYSNRARIQSKVSTHSQERDTFVTHSRRKHDLWHMTGRHFGLSLSPWICGTLGQRTRFPKIWSPDMPGGLLKKSIGILFRRFWWLNTAHCNSHGLDISKNRMYTGPVLYLYHRLDQIWHVQSCFATWKRVSVPFRLVSLCGLRSKTIQNHKIAYLYGFRPKTTQGYQTKRHWNSFSRGETW